MKISDPCPECGEAVIRERSQFYWRGTTEDGAVCKACDALYPIDGEEIEPLKATTTRPGVRDSE